MDHDFIEKHQIADRYVMGTLAAEEAERFEDHYLSCPECLDRLELAEGVQRGFRRMANQDAAQLSATRQLALVAWLARLGRSRQLAVLFTAVLVLAVLPAGLSLRGLAERGRELAQVRSALEAERQRTSIDGDEAARLHSELEASRRDLTAEREARTRAEEQLSQARQPQANVPLLFLDAERGSGDEPTHSLRRPAPPGVIVLDLVVDPPLLRNYRAVLRDARGRELWSRADLRPNERETLTLTLPASLLPPGDYSLSLAGLSARFTFRILPPA